MEVHLMYILKIKYRVLLRLSVKRFEPRSADVCDNCNIYFLTVQNETNNINAKH